MRCLPELMGWWRDGETVGVGTVVATFRSAPAPARGLDARRPGRRGGRLGVRRLRRGRGLRAGAEVVGSGTPVLQRYGVSDDDAFAVGLTCGGILDVYVEKVDQQTFPELGEVAEDVEAGRPGRGGDRRRAPRPVLGRPAARRPPRRRRRHRVARLGPGRRRRRRRRPAACWPPGTRQTLTYGPDGERRGEGMRVFVWSFAPAPADAGLRRHRLRRRRGPDGQLPRLPGHRLRRPAGLRDRTRGSRSADEVVVKWPHKYLARRDRRRPHRPAHRALRAHPRPQVRRAAARGRAAAAGGGVRRRDGLAAHPRRPDGPAQGGRTHRRRAAPGCPRPSASTSAPAPRRRPRSASPPRSSRCAGAAAASGSRRLDGRIHH